MAARRGAKAGNRGQGSNWIRREKRMRIYARDGWRCVWCRAPLIDGRALKAMLDERGGTPLELATLDHFLPRGLGGDNTAGNLITCCTKCNEMRGSTPALAWAHILADRGPSASHAATVLETLERALEALATPLERGGRKAA